MNSERQSNNNRFQFKKNKSDQSSWPKKQKKIETIQFIDQFEKKFSRRLI